MTFEREEVQSYIERALARAYDEGRSAALADEAYAMLTPCPYSTAPLLAEAWEQGYWEEGTA